MGDESEELRLLQLLLSSGPVVIKTVPLLQLVLQGLSAAAAAATAPKSASIKPKAVESRPISCHASAQVRREACTVCVCKLNLH